VELIGRPQRPLAHPAAGLTGTPQEPLAQERAGGPQRPAAQPVTRG